MIFGWCHTGHHSDCRKSYHDWNQKEQVCDCTCHAQVESPDAGGEEKPAPANKRASKTKKVADER